MNQNLIRLFIRWGLLCAMIGFVSAVGVLMSKSLSMKPEIASTFPIAMGAIAIVLAHMYRISTPLKDMVDVAMTLGSAVLLLAGFCFLAFLGVLMTALTLDGAAIFFFALVMIEWVVLTIKWRSS